MDIRFEVRQVHDADAGVVGHAVWLIQGGEDARELDWSSVDSIADGLANAALGPLADRLRSYQRRAEHLTRTHRDKLLAALSIAHGRAQG